MSTQDTTKVPAVSLQDRVAALDDVIDQAMRDPDMDVDREFLQRERNLIAIAEGGEAGRITHRISELATMRVAAMEAREERDKQEAGVVWDREINGVMIVMDGDLNLALTDFKDDAETMIELPRRSALALAGFWAELFRYAIRATKEEKERK